MTYVLDFNREIQQKAKKYFYTGLVASFTKIITILFLTLTVFYFDLHNSLYKIITSITTEQTLVIGMIVSIGYWLFWLTTLPFTFYKEHHLERKYDLSMVTLKNWLKGNLKTTMIIFTCVLLFFEGVYNFTRIDITWIFVILIGAVFFLIFQAFSSSALVESKLHRSEKIKDKNLLSKFQTLLSKAKMKDIQICKIKSDYNTNKAIADSNGLAKNKKISISDTMLNTYSEDEIESIIGHEIGHHKYGHQLKFSLIFSVTILCAFIGTYLIWESFTEINLVSVSSIIYIPALALVFGLLYFGFTPLVNTISRHAENRCDQYELELVQKPKAYISSIIKLCDQNLRYTYPNSIIEFLFYDHPSGEKRLKRAIQYMKSYP